jgi:hypothetical protein
MSHDLFGDEDPDPEMTAFREDCDELMGLIGDFAEERNMDGRLLAGFLIEAALSVQASSYMVSVEKPSEAGMKLDLDRFRRVIDDIFRNAKKSAAPTLAALREQLAKLEEDGATERGTKD